VLGNADFPRWSPDGRRLAFRAGTNSDNGVLTVGGPLGQHPKRLVSGRVNWFAWSPDGAKIAFIRNDDVQPPSRATVEIVGRNGRGHRVVARGKNLFRLWWSDDSRRLYFDGFVGR
jgi:dipeptidyl aminopeptidase/acylaminoacyl peptidase